MKDQLLYFSSILLKDFSHNYNQMLCD